MRRTSLHLQGRPSVALTAAGALLLAGGARAQPAPSPGPAPAASAPAPVAAPLAPRPPSLTMTLREALEHARAHQPEVRAALAEVRAREAEADVPRAQWLPRVGATAQIFYGTTNNTTALSLNVREVDLPRIGATRGTGGTNLSPFPSTLVAASVTQELFDFGRFAAQIAAADARAEAARAGAANVDLVIALGVEEAFHGVLAAVEVQRATEDAYRRALTHRDFAAAGVRSGMRPTVDLTRAQARIAQLEVGRVRAVNGVDVARAALASAVGADVVLVDAAPLPAGDAGAPAFEEAMQRAAARSPLVAAATANLLAEEARTRALARELLPNVFGSAGLSARAGGAPDSAGNVPTGDGWLPDVVNWYVGAVLQWSAFDGTLLARRSASRAREDEARAQLDAVRRDASLGAARAWLSLDAAVRALPSLAEAVAAARANQAQAEARFRAGLGNVVELADAEGLLTSAELELAIGRFTVARTRAELARAMGDGSAATTGPAGKAP